MDWSEGYKPRRAKGPDVCVPSRKEAARREQAKREDNTSISNNYLVYPLSAAY